jgi:hypothetical protein
VVLGAAGWLFETSVVVLDGLDVAEVELSTWLIEFNELVPAIFSESEAFAKRAPDAITAPATSTAITGSFLLTFVTWAEGASPSMSSNQVGFWGSKFSVIALPFKKYFNALKIGALPVKGLGTGVK